MLKYNVSAWEDIYSIYPSTSALKKVVTRSYPSGKVFKKIIHRKKSTFVYSEIEQLVLNISNQIIVEENMMQHVQT